MDTVIIALHHGTLPRKFNLFFSLPTPHPSTFNPSFLYTSRFAFVRFFWCGGVFLGCAVLRRSVEAIQLSKKCEFARVP
jgi:hypothetical protein